MSFYCANNYNCWIKTCCCCCCWAPLSDCFRFVCVNAFNILFRCVVDIILAAVVVVAEFKLLFVRANLCCCHFNIVGISWVFLHFVKTHTHTHAYAFAAVTFNRQWRVRLCLQWQFQLKAVVSVRFVITPRVAVSLGSRFNMLWWALSELHAQYYSFIFQAYRSVVRFVRKCIYYHIRFVDLSNCT